MDSLKLCPSCKESKPLDAFHTDKSRKSGRCVYCKICLNWKNANTRALYPEKVKEWKQKWKLNNPEAVGRWQRENLDKVSARGKRYYAKNKARENARTAKWFAEHPDRRRQLSRAAFHKRRARRIGNGGAFTLDEWSGLLEEFGNRCLCCGACSGLSADHIVPLIKGGTSYIENIQPLCRRCNAKKGSKVIDYRPTVRFIGPVF